MQSTYDLIVVGGGTSGSICAIAAAKEGLKVAIVESNTFLGGMATGSGLAEMNAAGFNGKPLYSGIEKEIFDELINTGNAAYYFGVPMSSNKEVKIDRLRYNPEILKIILEEKALQFGIDIFYGTSAIYAKENENGCLLGIESRYQKSELQANYLVDATGNCQLVEMLGYHTVKPEFDSIAISTLVFRLSNVDLNLLQTMIDSGQLAPIIKDGFEQGILKGHILAFSPIPGTNDVSVNVTRAKLDYEDISSFSAGLADARKQILPIINFIRQRISGMENAYLSNIAPLLGVRDSRKLIGEYQLSIQDFEDMTDFPDSIAVGCYPMDFHDPVTKRVIWKMLPGIYRIPYRSLIPQNAKRVLVIGKSISADEKAFAALRVMPIVMNIGESAGYAIAKLNQQNKQVKDLNMTEFKQDLTKKGISL